MARPTKYNSRRSSQICESLKNGATRTASVAAAGVSYDAYRRWLKSNPEFSASVMRAEAECAVMMTKVIYDAGLAGDWRASFWWLERRRPQDWGRRPPADPEVMASAYVLLKDLFGAGRS